MKPGRATNFSRLVPVSGRGLVGILAVHLLASPVVAWCVPALAQFQGRTFDLPVSSPPGFTPVDPGKSGLRFTNSVAEERHLTNQIFLNGSGVAAGDVDGDGRCDLFLAAMGGGSSLFRNLGGWRFEDITKKAGLKLAGLDCTGVVMTDVDGDGDLDILVATIGAGLRVLLNNGAGHFSEPPLSGQLNAGAGGMSLALADFDGDGDLDCYLCNYRTVTIRDQPNTRFTLRNIGGHPQVVSVNGVPVTDPALVSRFNFRVREGAAGGTFDYDENGEADVLLRNDGGGNFTPVSWTGGTFLDVSGQALAAPPYDWGLSVMFRDFTGDGTPDLYVCNDFKSPDRIWVNDGRGRFHPLPSLALRQTSLSSMGVDFADLNRDGHDDFLVVDMLSREHLRRFTQRIDIKPEFQPIGAIANRPQVPRNTLFLARGDGTWAETARFSGLEASEWSWTPIFLDVDLDGYEDVLIANGFARDGMNMDVVSRIEAIKKSKPMSPVEQLRLRTMFPKLETASLAFRNLGNMKFVETGPEWGFNQRGISQGMCLADLDNDGDLDVVINNLNAPATLFRNESTAPRVAVKLKGRAPNTQGIGARMVVRGGAVPMQSQEMIAGGRYLSADEPLRVFAAGALTNRLTVEVTWRSGRRSVLSGVKPNTLCEVDEATSEPAPRPAVSAKSTLFTDASHLIQHTHHEEPFDDFALQPTLPRRLSQLGPGVSWFDVNGDGWDDLIVASGKGGALTVFVNQTNGGFAPLASSALAQTVMRDQTTILGWRRGDGRVGVIAGSANYEDGLASGSVARIYDLASNTMDDSLPGAEASVGPLALVDVDGDGNLDLFVGGRVRAGHYPEAVDSLLFRGNGKSFALDPQNSNSFSSVGQVSGAVFTDLDNDGDPDLVLACDLGPVRIYRNDQGRFNSWDAPVELPSLNGSASRTSLSRMVGWWNGVTAGDFDGDGRMDLAASNWGRNTRYESLGPQPVSVFHGALFPDGMAQVVEGYTETGTGRLLPLQPFHLMGAAMPALRERFGTFESYARATLPEIYGDAWRAAHEVRVTELESMVFLNRGDHFMARRLPMEAALAPAFALVTADFDGDGHEDLFLSQNFFALPPETSRYDAGRGLLLRGTGSGDFSAMPGQESGLLIYGEQRGAAAADFDGDGRTDLVVAQNGNETRLLRNANARPGLRVRLQGTPGNLSAVGAQLRLVFGGHAGAVRELHAGSGYWSQDSAVAVLASTAKPESLQVRWPGGKVTTHALPEGAAEVMADASGGLVVLRKTK